MAAALDLHQLGAGHLGHAAGARDGLNAIVGAVNDEHRAADAAIHLLADVERRRDGARRRGVHQRRAVGLGRPFDAVLELLARVRLGKHVLEEEAREIGVVAQPVLAVVLVPALELIVPGREMGRRHVGMARADGGGRADEDRRARALRVMRRKHRGEPAP